MAMILFDLWMYVLGLIFGLLIFLVYDIEKIKSAYFRFKDWISEVPGRVKRKLWNRGILLKSNQLYVRKDEFHKSLDLDVDAIYGRSKEEKQKYLNDLVRRRNIAHERDLD